MGQRLSLFWYPPYHQITPGSMSLLHACANAWYKDFYRYNIEFCSSSRLCSNYVWSPYKSNFSSKLRLDFQPQVRNIERKRIMSILRWAYNFRYKLIEAYTDELSLYIEMYRDSYTFNDRIADIVNFALVIIFTFSLLPWRKSWLHPGSFYHPIAWITLELSMPIVNKTSVFPS